MVELNPLEAMMDRNRAMPPATPLSNINPDQPPGFNPSQNTIAEDGGIRPIAFQTAHPILPKTRTPFVPKELQPGPDVTPQQAVEKVIHPDYYTDPSNAVMWRQLGAMLSPEAFQGIDKVRTLPDGSFLWVPAHTEQDKARRRELGLPEKGILQVDTAGKDPWRMHSFVHETIHNVLAKDPKLMKEINAMPEFQTLLGEAQKTNVELSPFRLEYLNEANKEHWRQPEEVVANVLAAAVMKSMYPNYKTYLHAKAFTPAVNEIANNIIHREMVRRSLSPQGSRIEE